MSKDMTLFLLLVSVFTAAGVLAFLCIRYHLLFRRARRRLQLTEARLSEYRRRLTVLRKGGGGGRSFSDVLGWASGSGMTASDAGVSPDSGLRTRLQRGQHNSSGIVERYRLVANMARRGLSADDIGAILQLSRGETEQLLRLSEVGRSGV